nr:hypothetical protein CFP56_57582 [Quercus suber]
MLDLYRFALEVESLTSLDPKAGRSWTIMVRLTVNGDNCHDAIILKPTQVSRAVVVDVGSDGFVALVAGAKETVPQPGLFAIVVTLLPALAVVQVMVLSDKLSVEELEQRSGSGRWGDKAADARVTKQFGEDDVLMAQPPIVETHRESDQLHRRPSEKRDDEDVEEFLLVVCVEREERVGVLGKVVRAVVLPQAVEVMHAAVVPVKPKIEDDWVDPDLDGCPEVPVTGGGCLTHAVCDKHSHHRSPGGCGEKAVHHSRNAVIGNLITRVLVAVQTAVLIGEHAKHSELVNGVQLEGKRVHYEDGDVSQVLAGVHNIGLVEEDRPQGVYAHPNVALPVWQIGHFVGFGVFRHVLIVLVWLDTEEFQHPVVASPLLSVAGAPSGLHGILWIAGRDCR